MPFKSKAQRRFLYANHPEIAKRWSAEYPDQGKLPEHAKKGKRKMKSSVKVSPKKGGKGKTPFNLASKKGKGCAHCMDLPKGKTAKPKMAWDA